MWESDVRGEVCEMYRSGSPGRVARRTKKNPTEASRRIQILHIGDFVGVVLLRIPSEAAV